MTFLARTTARGHGAFGMRSNQRTYRDLDQLSAVRRHTYAERQAGQLLSGGWTADGGAWFIPKNDVFDGKPVPVDGVVISGATLTRVETIVACQATPGTWFWDNAQAVGNVGGADDEDFGADQELGVDDGAELYVHLPGGVDPNAVPVLVLTIWGEWTGTKENPALAVQPILGPELLTDGSFESWNSATDLVSWIEALTGAGWTVNQDAALIDDGGIYSARFESTGAAVGSAFARQDVTLVDGGSYRLSGAHKSDAANPTTSKGYAKTPSGSPLFEDGRNTGATDGAPMLDTMGEVRRFTFDFLSPAGSNGRHFLGAANSAASACKVWLDGVSLRRIWGWRLFEPRLSSEGLPELMQGASGVFPGEEEGGGGTLTILNDALEGVPGILGYLEGQLSRWAFTNKRVTLRQGGQFLDDGQDIPWEDMAQGYTGIVRRAGTGDDKGAFELTDYRAQIDAVQLPLRRYNKIDTPNVREAALERHRPYWIGYETNVSPERIDTEPTTGLPIYELTDPAIAVHATEAMYTVAGAFEHVWVYENYDAAAIKDAARRVELAHVSDYDKQGTLNERIRLVRNPGPIRIEAGVNDRADFKANGVTYQAEIAPGLKTWHQLKGDLTTLFNLLTGGSPFTWIFDESSGGLPHHKFSVAYVGAGTLELLLATGATKDRSVYKTLGFTGDADLTGATGYTADTAVPYDADTAPIILRVDNYGIRDDAAGTYTGVPNGPFTLASDIWRLLLVKVLNFDSATQISSTLTTARTTCPQEQSVYLGGLTSVQGGASFALTMGDIRSRFAIGCGADIVFDSKGVAYFVARTNPVPANAPHFYDYDYLEWYGELPAEDVYSTVRVNFAQDPTLGTVLGREGALPAVALLHGDNRSRTFDTFLRFEYDAANALARLQGLALAPIRHFAFRVVGRGAALKIGDIVLLDRSRALQGPLDTGGLTNYQGRVMYVSKNPIDGSVSYIVHSNVA